EAPSGGARAFGYFALFKVTRRKGETASRQYRRNGYAPIHHEQALPLSPTVGFHREFDRVD
ncbi:hypothetical protein, partial [Pseudomonas izuensis]|uniref:hypothetical protein n=1 Tax=Pseudomonas izuensis TaxID=2684212 RepID=UPI001C4998C0